MRIWIDLANSPHVHFFTPIVRQLRKRACDVILTARRFAQTLELSELLGLPVTEIGAHGGSGTWGKMRCTVSRAFELRRYGKICGADVAVSHNSYAHCIAARSLGMEYMTIMDFEHTPANHVAFRMATKILLPASISESAVRKYGAVGKVVAYDGFKEQVYLDGFTPEETRLEGMVSQEDLKKLIIVVARPPADFAIYHRFRNVLFDRWLQQIGSNPAVRVILIPRTPEQRNLAAGLGLPSVVIPHRVVDGPNLIAHADLVVSAGGTMNREAAILGTPAYSMFAGEVPAVDRMLEAKGRMTLIRTVEDLTKIRLVKKQGIGTLGNSGLCGEIVDAIMSIG